MTKIRKPLERRKQLRLPQWDYSNAGYYFVTVCSKDRVCLLGDIVEDQMRENECGRIVTEIWSSLPQRFEGVDLGAFVVMPDHFHGIIVLNGTACGAVGAVHEPPLQRRAMMLPMIMGYLKMNSAKRINALRRTPGIPVWQRNYYEHVIRDGRGHASLREYIDNNPLQWALDEENPGMIRRGGS